jgi:curved DNA-binding protein CbpA
MDGTEPHEVLGVDEDASEEEIKGAYREKVKRYHPDVSDAEDAETVFRRIHEAYNSMMSEDRGGEERGGRKKGRGKQGKTPGDGASEKASRTASASDNRGRRGEAGGRAEERFKIMEGYEGGWMLAVCREGERTGEWVVYQDAGGGRRRYLRRGGETTKEAVYFGTRRQAEMCYETYAGRKRGEDKTNRERRPTGGRGSGAKSPNRRTGDERSGGQKPGGRGGVQGEKVGGFDSLWSLYRADSEGGDVWAVVSEASGSPYYLNRDGEQQRDGFWFESRAGAERAYGSYMDGAVDMGKDSRNLTGGGRGDERERRGSEKDGFDEGTEKGVRPPVSFLGAVLDGIDSGARRTVVRAGLALAALVLILLIVSLL